MPARVRDNDSYLDGAITSIPPIFKDGAMTIVVGLKDKANANLRSNLRVDVEGINQPLFKPCFLDFQIRLDELEFIIEFHPFRPRGFQRSTRFRSTPCVRASILRRCRAAATWACSEG